jgi:large subunit ribosomal protein L23
MSANPYDIIIKPHLTEKAYDGFAAKKYVFKVSRNADKTEIKKAVEEIFKVKVKSVNTVNVRGKLKTQGRTSGYTPDYKKAIVQLTADSTAIKEFEGLS